MHETEVFGRLCAAEFNQFIEQHRIMDDSPRYQLNIKTKYPADSDYPNKTHSRCLYAFDTMNDDEQLQSARKAIREALAFAHSNLYLTNGQAWRQIIASLAFETKAELSLIQYLDEQDQARFQVITQAFMDGVLPVGDMVDLYLEWFPRPKEWKDFDDN